MGFMKKVFIFLAVAVLILVVVSFFLANEFEASRSIVIKAPPEKVHEYVGDLRKWDAWAPWKESDPSLEITYGEKTTGVGATQSWKGEKGGGRLTFTMCDPGKGITYDLVFDDRGPKNVSSMLYEVTPEGTKVTWALKGKIDIPVLGPYFALLVKGLIAEEFEKGLRKLAEAVEGG